VTLNTFLQNGEWVTISDKLPWYRSIRFKLAFSYIGLSVLLLVTFLFIILNSIESYYLDSRINEVRTEAVIMANYVAGVHGFDNLEQAAAQQRLQNSVFRRSDALSMRILVINDGVRIIADSNEGTQLMRVGQTIFLPEVLSALDGDDTHRLIRDRYVLNVAASIHDESSDRVGAVLFVVSVEDIFQSLTEIRTTLFLATFLIGLLSIVLMLIISYYLTSPLKRTLSVVRRMTTGQLSLRVPVKSSDEYAVLARALNSMSEKLEQVDKTREEFVSNVSHEMKTPLSAIKVLSESILLQETAPEEMYREFLQDITQEVDRMTNITNDLLALVKIDRRDQGLNLAQTDLNQLVEDILKRLSPLAEQKKIVLLYEAMRQVLVDADDIKLSLAISNIVENGIKYTPNGGTVRVIIDSDFQAAIITIQDTGIGIPQEEQDKIFTRFYRVDKTRDRETGGTGLGLAITRSTVLLHNGSVNVSSKEDEGTTFTVRIPLRR